MAEQVLICIGCPLGCSVTLTIGDKGEIENAAGNQCKEGKDYAVSEWRAPVRVFTTTMATKGGGRFLPVRTDKPVHKERLKELAQALARVKVAPPIKTGEVIIYNVLGTGANLVASSDL